MLNIAVASRFRANDDAKSPLSKEVRTMAKKKAAKKTAKKKGGKKKKK